METSGVFFVALKKKLGIKPRNKFIYQRAFTHSSLNLKDELGNQINFERLEFLGDSFLNTIITEYIFENFPLAREGELSKLRAKIVSREKLNTVGKKLGLIEFIDANISSKSFGDDIHGNLLESLVGAIFIDMGYTKGKRYIMERIVRPHVDLTTIDKSILSYKSVVIEWGQKKKLKLRFFTIKDNGLDPLINYSCTILLDKKIVVKAREISKKKAEEKAAKRAYIALKINPSSKV